MKKHYHPIEALGALYKKKQYPDAALNMRHISPSAINRIQKETIFLSDVSEWNTVTVNCVDAQVLGAVASYKHLMQHVAVPDKLKSAIKTIKSSHILRSNTLGFALMKDDYNSAVLNALRLMDARIVLSKLSEKGSIETRTIKLSVFRPLDGPMDLRLGEIPSHIIVPTTERNY